jgi:hypothetical protein
VEVWSEKQNTAITCTAKQNSRRKGQVNFTTLKGLSAYSIAVHQISPFAPKCLQKYNIHAKIHTPTDPMLCEFLPMEYR